MGPNRRRKEERRRPARARFDAGRRDAFLNETSTVSRIEASTLASLSLEGYQSKRTCRSGRAISVGCTIRIRRREVKDRKKCDSDLIFFENSKRSILKLNLNSYKLNFKFNFKFRLRDFSDSLEKELNHCCVEAFNRNFIKSRIFTVNLRDISCETFIYPSLLSFPLVKLIFILSRTLSLESLLICSNFYPPFSRFHRSHMLRGTGNTSLCAASVSGRTARSFTLHVH